MLDSNKTCNTSDLCTIDGGIAPLFVTHDLAATAGFPGQCRTVPSLDGARPPARSSHPSRFTTEFALPIRLPVLSSSVPDLGRPTAASDAQHDIVPRPTSLSETEQAMLAALAWFASENIALSRVAQAGDRMIALQTALLEIGETLRDSRDTQQMALATARIVGRVLSADRAGFASADEAAETFDAETDWTAPGALSVTGRHRLEAYDVYPNRLAHGEPLVVHDAHNDGQTRHDLPGVWPVGVRSLVAMPICENGKTIGVFFVHLAHPRSWPAEEIAFLRSAADRLQAGVVQHGAAQRQRIVNGEIAHRLKNALTMVQAIANQTLRTVTDREAVYAFGRRLVAIGAAHDALLGSDWTQTDLRTVASTVAETAGFADRCALEGPPVMLQPRAALSFSLIVHELLTNACKYGALSNDDGEVSLRWSIVGGGDADDRLVIRWQESGGPPVNEPARSGFGSKLIGIGLVGAGGVSLRYERSGFSAEMQATLHSLARV